jgi:cell division protein FtsZ
MQAVKQSMISPLLEFSIDGSKGILFNIVGGENLEMQEVNEIAELITQNADPNAQVIFGAAIDPEMHDEIKVTLVATRFNDIKNKKIEAAKEQVVTFKNEEQLDELEIPAFLRKKSG